MGEITICKRVGGKLELNIEGLQKHNSISNLEPNVPIVFISVIADPEQSELEPLYTKEIINALRELANNCTDKTNFSRKKSNQTPTFPSFIKPNEKSKICMWPEAFHLKNCDGTTILVFVLFALYSYHDLKSQQLDSLEIFLSIASSEIVEVHSKKREYRLRCIHDALSNYNGRSRNLCGAATYFLALHFSYMSSKTAVEKEISNINRRYQSPTVYRHVCDSIRGAILDRPLNHANTFGNKNPVGSSIEESFRKCLSISNEIVKQIDLKKVFTTFVGKGNITDSDKKRQNDKSNQHSEEKHKQIQTRETVSSGSTSLKYPEQHSLSYHKRISVPNETLVIPVNVSLDSDTKIQIEYNLQHQSQNSIQKQNPTERKNRSESTSFNQQHERLLQPWKKSVTESNDAALRELENLLNVNLKTQVCESYEQENTSSQQKLTKQVNSSAASSCNQDNERRSQSLPNILIEPDDTATKPINSSSDSGRKGQIGNSHQNQKQMSEPNQIKPQCSSEKPNLYQLLQKDPNTCLQNIIVPDDAVIQIQVNIIQSTRQIQEIPQTEYVEAQEILSREKVGHDRWGLTERAIGQGNVSPVPSKTSVHFGSIGKKQASHSNDVDIVAEQSLLMVTNSLENTNLEQSKTTTNSSEQNSTSITSQPTDLPKFEQKNYSVNTTVQISTEQNMAIVLFAVLKSREVLKETLNFWDLNNTNFSCIDILNECLETACKKLNANFRSLSPKEVEYVIKEAATIFEEAEKDLLEIHRLLSDFVCRNIKDPESSALRILVNFHVLRKRVLKGNEIQQQSSRKLLIAICKNCFLQYINKNQTNDAFLLLVGRFDNFYKQEFERYLSHGPFSPNQMKMIEDILIEKCVSELANIIKWYFDIDLSKREKIIGSFCKKIFYVHLSYLKKKNLELLEKQHRILSKILLKVRKTHIENITQETIVGFVNLQQFRKKALNSAIHCLNENINNSMRSGEPHECHQKTLEARFDAKWTDYVIRLSN